MANLFKFKEEKNLKHLDYLYQEGNQSLNKKDYERAIDAFRKIIFYNSCYKDVCVKLELAKQEFLKKNQVQEK